MVFSNVWYEILSNAMLDLNKFQKWTVWGITLVTSKWVKYCNDRDSNYRVYATEKKREILNQSYRLQTTKSFHASLHTFVMLPIP